MATNLICITMCRKQTTNTAHSTFRSVEMHSKGRYKICICSVILGKLEAFQNYKGFSVIFPKILDAIERFKVMLHGTIRNDDFSA